MEGDSDRKKSQRLVTVTRAAKILGFNRAVLYRKILSGAIPAYRIASSWRIDVEEIKLFGRRGADREVERRAAKEKK